MSLVNASTRYNRSNAKSYARANLRGVWGAIPYPFTHDNELDEQGLRSNIRYCIDNKLLDGIYCGHFMSEFWALTTEERKRAAEIVKSWCDLMGMVGGAVRLPLMQATVDEREALRKDLASVRLI